MRKGKLVKNVPNMAGENASRERNTSFKRKAKSHLLDSFSRDKSKNHKERGKLLKRKKNPETLTKRHMPIPI